MQFIDLGRQQARIKTDLDARMQAVLAHGAYVMGPEVRALETEPAAYVGVDHGISVSDGTTALLLALMALEVGPGDEVITTAFSFIATAEVIALLGARPVFVDVDPETYLIDVRAIEAAITPRTRAIIPVDLYGQCADYASIAEVARGIPVIEDAAQSFGATQGGRRAGSFGAIGCTSFFPSKPLGCYGDGGMCFTDDPALAERLASLRVHGQAERYCHTRIGLNGRLDTLQAAILLAKFAVFEDEVKARERLGTRYREALGPHVKVQTLRSGNTSVYAQFTLEVDERAGVVEALKRAGIPTAVHYPSPLHLQPAFAYLGYAAGSAPVAERASGRVLSLPMHPYLLDTEQDAVVRALLEAIGAR